MILDEIEANNRLESEDNLINRLRNGLRGKTTIPALPPSVDELVEDIDKKITDQSIKTKAAAIMTAAMDELEHRMPEIKKPEVLAKIANEMGKVITAQNEKGEGNKAPQFLVYAPQLVQENHYETVQAKE